jgi:hypothetical protein
MIRLLAVVAVLAGACDINPYALGGGGGGGGNGSDGGGTGGDGGAGTPDAATCIPTGPDDTCDGVDNDCNGVVDDLFDKQNDDENCGACGVRCTAPGAILTCTEGECTFVECQPGFVDLDPNVPGCEYQCPVFPPRAEDCNGVDDDCDGEIDEVTDLPPPPAGLCRNTPGTPCEGVSMVCATRGAPPVTRWYCDYPPEVEFDPTVPNGIVLEETLCDGHDGDCDGAPDDPFTDLGQECDNGELGICRDGGVRVCDPGDPSRTICDLSVPPDPLGTATAEVCNGLDDNCDGIVDNPTGPDRVIDDMVHVTHGGSDFWIYTYEASRPDATTMAGGASAARSCSRPGVLPWRGVTFAGAAAACAVSGKRLCTADEYLAACGGASGFAYPYGNAFDVDVCNAEPYDGIPGGPNDNVLIPTGAATTCTSEVGAFDLSGNLKEWTDDITGQTDDLVDIAVLRGGAYDTPAQGATCDFRSSRAAVDTVLPTIGFRCCSDTAP